MTRYYYTCPIKALYMMKEFGVEFEIQNEDFDDKDDGFAEPYFDFRLWEIESPETINTLLDILDSNGRIYAALQSEHIFQKTTSDICQKVGNSCQIILRGDKQFFEPEVEND